MSSEAETETKTMRAVVHSKYGPPAEVLSIDPKYPIPRPKPGQVLVKVRATSVHADVWHAIIGEPKVMKLMGAGFFGPNTSIPGCDFAGTVEELGENVTDFSVGDEVFSMTLKGMMIWQNGSSFAEYTCVNAALLSKKPSNITFEQAAVIPTTGYIAILNMPKENDFPEGSRALINGCGGALGQMAVQVLKAWKWHVTGVDCTERMEFMKEIGVDVSIDFKKENVQDAIKPASDEERYDFVLDIASKLKYSDVKPFLKDNGQFVLIGHSNYGKDGFTVFGEIPKMLKVVLFTSRSDPHLHILRNVDESATSNKKVQDYLAELVSSGRMQPPIVGKTYPLEDVVPAIQDLVDGNVDGRIVLVP